MADQIPTDRRAEVAGIRGSRERSLDRRGFVATAGAMALSSMLPGCGGGGGGTTGGGAPTTPDPVGGEGVTVRRAEVNPQVNVLPADGTITIAETTADTVTFAGDLPKLASGDVIVSGEGLGLLRKVVDTRQEGGQLIVATENAALVDVFDELDVDLTHTAEGSDWAEFQPADGVTASRLARPARQGGSQTSFEAQFHNTGLSATINSNNSISAKLDGTVSLGFGLDSSIQIDGSGVQSFRFVPRLNATSDVTLKAEVKGQGSTSALNYLVVVGSPVLFTIGPAPVVIFPTLFLRAQLSGAMAGGLKLTSDFTNDVQAGVSYTRGGGFATVYEREHSGSFLPEAAFYTSLTADVILCRARLSTAVYALGGPGLDLKLLDLQAKLTVTQPDPKIKFEAGLFFGASITAAFTWIDNVLPEANFEVASGLASFYEKTWEAGNSDLSIQ